MSTPTLAMMNGVSRFLSRRDKHHHEKHEKRSSKHARSKSRPSVPSDLYTIISNDETRTPDKEEEKKVNTLVQRLHAAGINNLGNTHAEYALARSPNDLDEAYRVLVLANDSFEGIIKDYDPDVKLLGAVNRNMVTCYLDALLFAMFARLDSFEAMLFDNFSDEPRKRLAAILRLWVNLLRSGRLITTDLTKHLQDALGKCGWEEATQICQQDASEAFTFITGALELPLLTLKMDIYHTGREDKEDDHKFVNERLLEVAIPEQDGEKTATLEDCLETYFNNRIEVKRYLQRQNTLTSTGSFFDKEIGKEKSHTLHVEELELPSGSNSPTVASPIAMTPVSPTRPIDGRRRADSIFTERYTMRGETSEKKRFDEKRLLDEMLTNSSEGRPRSASLRKEVLMPAWQFFSLIPWYTDNVPKSDAQVAAHFSAKRPVLGICLKRYMMLPNGAPKRLDTYIDIPLEIGLPHFITDDRMAEVGPLFGNFKLVLQSVVCHRGVSVDSGHYISLVRANLPSTRPGSSHSQSGELADKWLRFDDLAPERVTDVDIKAALKEESPYLLFFQVQPIDEELAARGDPPSYAEAQSNLPSVDPSRETLDTIASIDAATTDVPTTDAETTETETGSWEKVGVSDLQITEPEPEPFTSASAPPSIPEHEIAIGRSSTSSARRSSVTFEELEGSMHSASRGRTAPTTPDDGRTGFLSTSRRNSKNWIGGSGGGNKSRPSSQSGESRLSLTMSRLTGRGSKDKLQSRSADGGGEGREERDPVIVVNEVGVQDDGREGVERAEGELKIDEGGNSQREKGSGWSAAAGGSIGRSKSKRLRGGRSKSRDPGEGDKKEGAKGKEKRKEGKRPDRECVVM